MPTRIVVTRVVNDDDLGRQIEPHMRSLGNAIGTRMQRLVPKRTWALHDTIAATTERDGARVVTEVKAGGRSSNGEFVDYDQIVERGTSDERQRAQPYMRPALLQSKAGDLNFGGEGPKRHGVVRIVTRPARRTRRGGTS